MLFRSAEEAQALRAAEAANDRATSSGIERPKEYVGAAGTLMLLRAREADTVARETLAKVTATTAWALDTSASGAWKPEELLAHLNERASQKAQLLAQLASHDRETVLAIHAADAARAIVVAERAAAGLPAPRRLPIADTVEQTMVELQRLIAAGPVPARTSGTALWVLRREIAEVAAGLEQAAREAEERKARGAARLAEDARQIASHNALQSQRQNEENAREIARRDELAKGWAKRQAATSVDRLIERRTAAEVSK